MLQCTDNKKQPAANIIDGNVRLRVLSHIPDNFQGVTENVTDGLPKPSRVNIVTKANLYNPLGTAKYYWSKTWVLKHQRTGKVPWQIMQKSSLSNFCSTNVKNIKVFLEVHGRDIAFAKSEQLSFD